MLVTLSACANDTFEASEAGTASDAGASSSDGARPTDAGADQGAPQRKQGLVSARAARIGTALSFLATASFDPVAGECAGQTVGACLVEDCVFDGAAHKSPPTAGNITITGGAETYVVKPNTNEVTGYGGTPGPVPPWSSQASLVFAAAGGVVPAFHGIVAAPDEPTVSTPPFDTSSADVVFDATKDLPVNWSGGQGVVLIVELTPKAQLAGHTQRVTCRIPGTSGTIPKEVLGALTGPGAYWGYAASETVTNAGEWDVTMRASWTAKTAFGVGLFGNYTISK